MFDLGSNMACEFENRAKFNLPQITEALIKQIEDEIDRMDSELEPLKNFILPGGATAAAALHLVRTGARGVERKIIHYHATTSEELPHLSVIFLNRLSDYYFVMARYVNKRLSTAEITWKPRA